MEITKIITPIGINLDELVTSDNLSFPTELLDFPDDILILIIKNCSNLGKFIIHFVSTRLQKITMNNNKNRIMEISFVGYFSDYGLYGMDIKNRISKQAVIENSLNVLEWTHQLGCSLYKYTCKIAAKNGNLEMLKWARKKVVVGIRAYVAKQPKKVIYKY